MVAHRPRSPCRCRIEDAASVLRAIAAQAVDFQRKAVVQIAAHRPSHNGNGTKPPIFSTANGKLVSSNGLVMAVMLPLFFLAMYEKDGLPLEKVLKNMITVKFIRPPLRKYEVENMYEKRKIITKSKGGTVRGKKRK